MAKQIPLTQGQVATVDDADYELLNQWKWYAIWTENTQSFYAVRNAKDANGKYFQLAMQRQILGLKKGDRRRGDHIETRQTLNNQRSNLRIATWRENCRNRRLNSNNLAGFKGVSWNSNVESFQVRITVDKKTLYLGYSPIKAEAARMYDRAAIKLHGEFARLNFPREEYANG